MPEIMGIPLIGFIQMAIGAAIVIFILIKYITRPGKTRPGELVIKNVHIIVGDGTELTEQDVYIKNGLIDSHVHIQGLQNRCDEDSDRFLSETVPEIFKERILPYGITALKDLGSPRHFIYKLRDKIKSGEITGPELIILCMYNASIIIMFYYA